MGNGIVCNGGDRSYNNEEKKILQRTSSFHENLVYERDRRLNWRSIYDVVDNIGRGGFGLCTVYKIKKKEGSIGGSSHRRNMRRYTSWASLTISNTKMNESYHSWQNQEIFFALKLIDLSLVEPNQIDQLKNEVEILKTLDHTNIIKAYETYPIKSDKKLAIVMELCTGGDLHARLPYNELQAAIVTKQIISAISHVHGRNIVHRDLKFENIVFESNHPEAFIKVIDFGVSKKYCPIANPILTERVGTLHTMAPETMQGTYTSQADMWSIGVCTYMLLANGDKPFEGKTAKEVVTKVLSGKFNTANLTTNSTDKSETKENDNISLQAIQFIKSLIQVDPHQRSNAKEAMQHPWFNSINNEDISDLCDDKNDDTSTNKIHSSHGDHHDNIQMKKKTSKSVTFVEKVRDSIVRYADTGEFRKLALNVIAKKSTSDEIFELRKVFSNFDTLDTGTITFKEFKNAIGQKNNYDDDEIECIFRKLDVNRNNEINYTEFLAATLEAQGEIKEYRLAEAFDLMDFDDTGFISRNNLRKILGKHSTETYIDRLMQEVDISRDGKITYQEFLHVVLFSSPSLHKQSSLPNLPESPSNITSQIGKNRYNKINKIKRILSSPSILSLSISSHHNSTRSDSSNAISKTTNSKNNRNSTGDGAKATLPADSNDRDNIDPKKNTCNHTNNDLENNLNNRAEDKCSARKIKNEIGKDKKPGDDSTNNDDDYFHYDIDQSNDPETHEIEDEDESILANFGFLPTINTVESDCS